MNSQRTAFLFVAFVMAITAACGGTSGGEVSPSCARLESVSDRTGLISRSEAEKLAVERLAMSAPEVTGMEIERVVGSCLTTHGAYQQVLLEGRAWTNPDIRPPDTPVWIVEVKGISRPAGVSTAVAHIPYRYAMDVRNARTGEALGSARYQEPMLQPAQEE